MNHNWQIVKICYMLMVQIKPRCPRKTEFRFYMCGSQPTDDIIISFNTSYTKCVPRQVVLS